MSRLRLIVPAMAALWLCLAGETLADWFPGDPYKYRQPVDVRVAPGSNTPYATAVNASDAVVADDFPCTVTEPITSVHIYGAWDLATPPGQEPDTFQGFTVGFHADVPAQGGEPSRPGDELWRHTIPEQYITGRFGAGQIGWWYDRYHDPHWKQIILSGYQYNIDLESFCRDMGFELFVQQGSTAQPLVYWLSIRADNGLVPGGEQFGWISSSTHWNDDAADVALAQYTGGPNDPWNELTYSYQQHPLSPESMDMAFVLVPEPASLALFLFGAAALARRSGQGPLADD